MNLREEPPEKLTLRQAADALNASTSHVKGLLEQGLIDHHGEGARLRIDRDSLLSYKARDDQERQAALDELTRDAQEQGSTDLLKKAITYVRFRQPSGCLTNKIRRT